MSRDVYAAGQLVTRWDDTARTVTDYTTDPPTVRAYTADENAAADAAAAADQAAAEREAARLAVRAILDTINAQLDEARAAKAAAVAVLNVTAPTTVAQTWAKVKETARATRDTNNAIIGIGQGVKDIARLLRD